MKLLTWNTQWCRGLDGVVSVERIVADARAMGDFDVLCLQEIAVHYPELGGNAGHDQPALLRGLLPGFEVHFGAAVHERGRDGRMQQFGNLIATRLPVALVQHYALPYPADAGVRSMPRMCTSVTVRTAFGPLRVMTTHLEFYSPRQRLAQARALRALHAEACAQAAQPSQPADDGSPFQTKAHTASALLCGDFNFETSGPEYPAVQEAYTPSDIGATRLLDCWPLVHGSTPHQPTFHVFDRTYSPVPAACDFVFASEDIAHRVRRIEVNGATQVSDHQPVLVDLA
jgi:endonuclease/exonuclease/phosphatase family metal-dependent hydrolase